MQLYFNKKLKLNCEIEEKLKKKLMFEQISLNTLQFFVKFKFIVIFDR